MFRIEIIALDGTPLLSVGGLSFFNAWGVIEDGIAEQFNCSTDDVALREGEDGEEIITVHGKDIGTVNTKYNNKMPLIHRLQAAE